MSWLANWDKVIDRFNKKKASWKLKMLFIKGRLTLIKFIFDNLSILRKGG